MQQISKDGISILTIYDLKHHIKPVDLLTLKDKNKMTQVNGAEERSENVISTER